MNYSLMILVVIYLFAIGGSFCMYETRRMRILDILASLTLLALTFGAVAGY